LNFFIPFHFLVMPAVAGVITIASVKRFGFKFFTAVLANFLKS